MKKSALRFLVLTGARQYCRDYFTDLSSINSQEENDDLSATVPVWIGLYKDANDTWSWSGGKAASFFNWSERNYTSEDNRCVVDSSEGWQKTNCEHVAPGFYCFKSNLVLVKENKTWEQAMEWCRKMNMNLLRLPSESALVQALQTIREAQTDHVWTGLRYLAGQWLWVNGDNTPQAWSQDKMPQCPTWSQHCGTLSTMEQYQSSRDCADKLNFVCY
ncbi:hypothetical protein Q5P01_001294 [Channa striata]|uniref:C-type lectin domain-containing protein n=1 Tax=Channa striata TaxID=64152 RepID=A0AA88NQP7_CHASR|nr:hypothetical protein Q5P01_001294 [Channa striata]